MLYPMTRSDAAELMLGGTGGLPACRVCALSDREGTRARENGEWERG